MEVHIRRAINEDCTALAMVEITTWQTAYYGIMPSTYLHSLSESDKMLAWKQNLQKHGASGQKQVLVATADNAVIGFVRFGLDTATVGNIYLLYVLPEYWNFGVGKTLMLAALNGLKELGASEAILWVLSENERARRFYEKLGWKEDGQVNTADYGGTGLEALRYRISIQI